MTLYVIATALVIAAGFWTVFTAIATAIGGLGAAGGAYAAWRAATASLAASRDARDALSAAVRPQPSAEFNVDTGKVAVSNHSQWPAVDVTFDVALRDGRRFRWSASEVPGDGGSTGQLDYLGTAVDAAQSDVAYLRYSDQRRLVRYEQTLRPASGDVFTVTKLLDTVTMLDMQADERRLSD